MCSACALCNIRSDGGKVRHSKVRKVNVGKVKEYTMDGKMIQGKYVRVK